MSEVKLADAAAAPATAPAIKVQRNFYRAGLEDDKLVPVEDTNFGAEEEVRPRPQRIAHPCKLDGFRLRCVFALCCYPSSTRVL